MAQTKVRSLTRREQLRLAKLEETIAAGLKTFVPMGRAFKEIRQKKLFEGSHSTFTGYCLDRYGFKLGMVNHFIVAAEVVDQLQGEGFPTGMLDLDTAVKVSRLPEKARGTAFKEALITTGGRPGPRDIPKPKIKGKAGPAKLNTVQAFTLSVKQHEWIMDQAKRRGISVSGVMQILIDAAMEEDE